MMRRSLQIALCLVALFRPAVAQTAPPPPEVSSLAHQIATLLAQPAVARDHWGIQVTTLDGQPLYSLNEGQLFQPASNTKLFTTAAAMALLGGATTYTTEIIGKGTWTDSTTLTGDLLIRGDGDANLSGRAIPYVSPALRPKIQEAPQPLRYLEEMADKVAATGLKVVTGDVVGDDTLFPWEPYPGDWSIDDAVWGYGAPVSALTINDNQMEVTVSPASAAGQPATINIVPTIPYYSLEMNVNTVPGKSGSVQMERTPGSKDLRIYGSIGVDSPADVEEVAISDPAEFTASAFKQMLKARGIEVKGVVRAQHRISVDARGFQSQSKEPLKPFTLAPESGYGYGRSTTLYGCDHCDHTQLPVEKVLAAHTSPSLAADVQVTNKVSQNLHAELLLHHLANALGGDENGSTAQGARVVRQFLTQAGLDPHDFIFFDGSGLSGHDLVTPRATAKLLQFATKQPWFPTWKASLPIGGEDGTLESRFPKPPLKDHLFAKTGTLSEARALSGYLDTATGHTVIFSIMVGNHLPGDSSDRDVMDKIVAAIAAAE